MTTFSNAKQLIEIAEHRLLKAQHIPWPVSWLRKELLDPIRYVMAGLEFLLQNWIKMIVYPLIFGLAAIYVAKHLGLNKDQINAAVLVGMAIGVFVVLFALPSSFASIGISENDIECFTSHLQRFAASEIELGALRDSLEAMEEAAADRVKALRWAMATIWGSVLLAYSQSMGVLTKLADKDQVGELMSGSVIFFVVAGLLALAMLLAITGYRRANNIVFRGLQYACNEVSLRYGEVGALRLFQQ